VLADDPDYLVRVYVARRLPIGRLFLLATEVDVEVRRIVAERIPQVSLGLLANDTDGPFVGSSCNAWILMIWK
jgi:hypothetical protein